MKANYLTHWSKGIRLFLIATVIAFITLTTLAIPVAHASGGGGSDPSCDSSSSNCDSSSKSDGTAYTESYDSHDQTTCNEFHYLGGTWPARFHLGGCVIKNLKLPVSIAITLVGRILGAGLAEFLPEASWTPSVLATAVNYEITHISDLSNACDGTGVYIDFYSAVFRVRPVC